MFCKNCGSELKDGSKFCTHCGIAINDTEQKPEASRVVSVAPSPAYKHDVKVGEAPLENSQPVLTYKAAPKSNIGNEDAPTNFEDQITVTADNYAVRQSNTLVKPKNHKKLIFIFAGIALAIIAVIVSFSVSADTREMKSAIASKNSSRVNTLYSRAAGNESKLKKYDKVIAKTIEEIKKDINNHDFESAALADGYDAMSNYLKLKWGSLADDSNGANMASSISVNNKAAWDDLLCLLESKENYCEGLYAYKAENDYDEALEMLSHVIETDSEFENAKNMIGECTSNYIKEVLTEVENRIADDDISGGLKLLKDAKNDLSTIGIDSNEIETKINETLTSYAQTYANKAEEAFKAHDANAAIGNIEVALELQPDNASYKVKIDEYKQYLPFELYKKENILSSAGSKLDYRSSKTANNNTEFLNVFSWSYGSRELTNINTDTYMLKGQYDTVTGIMFVSDVDKDDIQTGYFEAYGDGKLLYTSPKMSTGVLPQNISFTVTDVQKLEIAYYGCTESPWGGSKTNISNFIAQKNFPQ